MNYDFLEQEIHDRFGYGNIEVFKPSADKCNFDIVQMEWGFIPLLCQKQETCKDARLGYKDASGKCHHTYIILNAKGGELLLVENIILYWKLLVISNTLAKFIATLFPEAGLIRGEQLKARYLNRQRNGKRRVARRSPCFWNAD
ncbi:hypothetical protein D7322_25620 [Sphingobacterium puteale]|uniref:Uncharacterized protein n=2 Tax=Sphingobacterium puteale TaxID=2420510 RepID=A0A420VR56_9SPHI|nr:hypothetical protein [Sphingobacterium puteale]RKO68775.1 hypothetical protein D7322_25620 [Sphingobacterium puteale]